MAIKNTFNIQADVKTRKQLVRAPEFVQNDAVRFVVSLTDSGARLDLSDTVTASLASERPDGGVVVTPGTINGNIVTFDLGDNEALSVGKVDATVQLYDADGRVSTVSFRYFVRKDPTGSDFVPTQDEMTLIETVMADAQAKIDEANAKITEISDTADSEFTELSLAADAKIAEIQENADAKIAELSAVDVVDLKAELAQTTDKGDNLHYDIVTQFNADDKGINDSSNALKNAIIESIKQNPESTTQKTTVYLPPGTFNIDLNKVFSDFDFVSLGLSTTVKKGLRFVGAGRYSTTLKLITNGTEKWFYDNESISNQKFSHIVFEHIGFETDDKSKGHGFKQWSQGGEKQFWFFDCHFDLGTIMQFEGTGNADLNRFVLCGITANEDAFIYNNNQSVGNELISCNVSLRKGYVRVKEGGGGSHKHIGGNLEMHPHHTDTADHYLFNFEQDANLGQGNCDYNLSDVRFEIHGANKKLVNTNVDTKQLNINFTRCQFGTVRGGSREVVKVMPSKRVVFENCILSDDFTYLVGGLFSSSGGTPSGSQLMFLNSDVGRQKNLHERITTEGDVYRVVAENCFRQSSSASANPVPQDFDFGWRNTPASKFPAKKKIVSIKRETAGFPIKADTGFSFLLPKTHYITRIYVRKPSANSSSQSYQLLIGSDDKSIVLGSSDLNAHNQEHIIDLKDVGTLDFNELRLWADGDATARQSSGVAYIEYI